MTDQDKRQPDDAATAGGPGRGEGAGEAKEVEGLSQGTIVRRKFFRHRGAMSALIVLALIALLAFSSMGLGPIPGWWKWQNYLATHTMVNGGAPTLSLPTWLGGEGFALGDHPFGQDNIGRDNFAQVMAGVKTSLLVSFVMGMVALLVGVTVGSLAGYYRGRLDMFLMRFTDLVITLPVIVVGAVLGRLVFTVPEKYFNNTTFAAQVRENMPILLAVALGLILWTGLARLVRSEFLTLREREFVDSARVAGASDFRIIVKHILPNAVGVIIVNTTLLMSQAVVLETALSFLGFGITEPNMSLGRLISVNQGAFSTRPWLFWWPGLFIILIALCANFIGDGLRDAFDPRTRKIPSERQMRRASAQLASATPTPEPATSSGTSGPSGLKESQ
jgi:peptide/nickel transport system permease protein